MRDLLHEAWSHASRKAWLVLLVVASPVAAQPAKKLTVGLYAPSVELGAGTARLAYVRAVGKAIEQATGLPVDARSYANLAALEKDKLDFAIVDGPCYATRLSWKLLATAKIDGSTTRPYALYASTGASFPALRGKKLAFVATGCNDAAFVDHAMLASEVDGAFFAGRSGKADLTAAIAEVASYKAAQAVFAPIGTAKGLAKVFDAGPVPNPAFVDLGSQPADVVEKVTAAITAAGGSGAIAGWTRGSRDIYQSLAARMQREVKKGLFATPEPVRIDARDVIVEPSTLSETALVPLRAHFVRPAKARLE
jgi:hypothetical protein